MTNRREFIRSLGHSLPAGAALPFLAGTSGVNHRREVGPSNRRAEDAVPGTIHDVREFGARGDGKTDDTAAIQAAIDGHPDKSIRVYFPSGTYRHEGLRVQTSGGADGSRILFGDGTQSRLVHTGQGPSIRLGLVSKPGTIQLRHLHIDAEGDRGTHGVQLDHTRTVMVSVRGCAISRHAGSGIYSVDSWHARVANCLIVRNGDAGVWLTGTNGAYLWANTIERNRIGVKLGASEDEYEGKTSRRVQGCRLAGMNIIQSNDRMGVLLRGVEGVSVTGNYFEANGVGVQQEHSINNLGSTIRENRFNISDEGCAIQLLGGRHSEIRANTVVGGGGGDDAAYYFAEAADHVTFEPGYVASTVSKRTVGEGARTSDTTGGSKLDESIRANRRRIRTIEAALKKLGIID